VNLSMEAARDRVLAFGEALMLGLKFKMEKQRGECLSTGQVVRTGNDNYRETVLYPVPAAHRITVGGTWSSGAYDPYVSDIMPAMELLRGEGWEPSRIITDMTTSKILASNAKILARNGRLTVVGGAVTNTPSGRVFGNEINALFGRDGVPPIELYDRQYRTQTGSGYYWPRGYMLIACTTGRNQDIDRGDLEPLTVSEVLGYTAVGPAAGEMDPGPVLNVDTSVRKPKTITGEAHQASLPVLEEPEAFIVLSGIA
jgi:hypothetical protein